MNGPALHGREVTEEDMVPEPWPRARNTTCRLGPRDDEMRLVNDDEMRLVNDVFSRDVGAKAASRKWGGT